MGAPYTLIVYVDGDCLFALAGIVNHLYYFVSPDTRAGNLANLRVASAQDAALCIFGGIATVYAHTLKSWNIQEQRKHLLETLGVGDDNLIGSSRDSCLSFDLALLQLIKRHGC